MKKMFVCFCLYGFVASALAGALVDVQIVDRSSGRVLETWHHQSRLYVAGTPGNRYAVSLRNRSGERVLAVLSVDGVNAVSGQTAATSQSGYVLTPGNSAEIAGWRRNLDEVAAFYFTSLGDSYAGRTGRPQHVGVIGVAVFREYEPPRVYQPAPRDFADTLAGAPSARMESRKAMPSAEESSAPDTASASTRGSAPPSSAAPAQRRSRLSPFTTTAVPIWWRAASFPPSRSDAARIPFPVDLCPIRVRR